MAYKTTFKALIAGAGAWLAIALAPGMALAGGTGGAGCGCKPPPPPPPPHNCNCNHGGHDHNVNVNVNNNNINVVTKVNVITQVKSQVDVQSQVSNVAGAFIGTQTQAQVTGGGGGAASFISPGSVTAVNLGVGGGEEREAYEAERTQIEKVVIQAFCFDDKDVPHPASQVQPDRDISEGYEGEVYRCIAGSHMQVTIAPWREQISFAGGQTLTCQKGEALWHSPARAAGGWSASRRSRRVTATNARCCAGSAPASRC